MPRRREVPKRKPMPAGETYEGGSPSHRAILIEDFNDSGCRL